MTSQPTPYARHRFKGGIRPCIPSNEAARLYSQRHRIANMIGRLKDWCRVATRYNRCA